VLFSLNFIDCSAVPRYLALRQLSSAVQFEFHWLLSSPKVCNPKAAVHKASDGNPGDASGDILQLYPS
jgi:hypothetical protein